MDERELLKRYAETGDEKAFAQLVDRYGSWLFSAARRRLGDEHLAEDVTQAVFMMLMRQARRLGRYRYVSGWMFLALGYCVKRAKRQQERLVRREKEAASMRKEAVEEAAWEEIAPELDEAVGKLGKADRDAVLLRFYEQRPLAEVGRALGISEEAARKRVERAVGKLRVLLAKKGISGTTAGLSAVLVGNVVERMPQGLAEKIVSAVGGGGGSTVAAAIAKGAMKMMAYAKLKVAAVVLGLVVAGGVIYAATAPIVTGDGSDPQKVSSAKPTSVSALLRQFETDYSTAASRLEKAYGQVSILADYTYDFDGSGRDSYKEQVEYLRDNQSMRTLKTVLASNRQNPQAGMVSSYCETPDLSFSIYKLPGEQEFTFGYFDKKPDDVGHAPMSARPLYAPYCVLDVRLTDWFREHPAKEAKASKLDGQDVIEVVAEYAMPGKEPRADRFFFQPQTWALRGFILARSSDGQGRIDYEPGTNPPAIRRLDYWEQPVGTDKRMNRITIDVRQIRFGPVPADAFTPAALGVKEVPDKPVFLSGWIRAHDMASEVAFYRDVLGFGIIKRTGTGNFNDEKRVVLETGGSRLVIRDWGDKSGGGISPGLLLQVKDVETVRKKLADRGVKMGKIELPNGAYPKQKVCDGTDPEGNLFVLIQYLEGPATTRAGY